MFRIGLALLLAPAIAFAQDLACPQYPSAVRAADAARTALARSALEWTRARPPRVSVSLNRNNLIDDILFGRMEADGIPPADLSTDGEFLRRVSLDLTGRIPQPEDAAAFLADTDPAKRSRLIDQLLASDAYADQWTFYFMDRFQAGEQFSLIGVPGNRVFYRFVRDFVRGDRSYRDFARDVITARGDNYSAPVQFLLRTWIRDGAPQDTWDAMADAVTTQFLGVTTQCISCHNGRRYLEKVNVYLSTKLRSDFWRLAAFFARTAVQEVNTDAQIGGAISTAWLLDRTTGQYNGFVSAQNPGIRPPRPASSYSPANLFNAEEPASEKWRQEFARMVTSDRQFARAAVNYLWAAMFGYGIVDPPNGWDFARTDPSQPLPDGWPAQNSQPELLEALAQSYIDSGYSNKALLRLIANSTVYQLSSQYSGQWQPAFARYFARRIPRRLTAEQIFDSVTRATQTETPMYLQGFDRFVYYSNQLPDVAEPRSDGRSLNFLSLLGRGVWFGSPARTTRPSLLGTLFMMNSSSVMNRTVAGNSGGNIALNRAARLASLNIGDEELVRQLFLATLVRYPTSQEVATAIAAKGPSRISWIINLNWALLNRLEFLFN
jgi:uncharacterized protein DUF1549/uncharacterized protein DUF1553